MFIFIACVAFIVGDTATAVGDVEQPLHRHGLHAGRQPPADHPQGARPAGHAQHLQLAAAAVRPGLRLHHAGRGDPVRRRRRAGWAASSTCRSAAAAADAHPAGADDHPAGRPGDRPAPVLDPARAVSRTSTAAAGLLHRRRCKVLLARLARIRLRTGPVHARAARTTTRSTAAMSQIASRNSPWPPRRPATAAGRHGPGRRPRPQADGTRLPRVVEFRHVTKTYNAGQPNAVHGDPRRELLRRGPAEQGRVRLRPRPQRLRQEHDPAADRRPAAAAPAHRRARCWSWASRSSAPAPTAAWSSRTTPASTTARCWTTSPSAWNARACPAAAATNWAAHWIEHVGLNVDDGRRTSTRTSSPAACGSAWPSPAR